MDATFAAALAGDNVTPEHRLSVCRQLMADFDAAIEGVETLLGRPGYVVGWPQHSLWLCPSDKSTKLHIGGVRWAKVWQREEDIPGHLLNAPNGMGKYPDLYLLDYAAKASLAGFRKARERILEVIASIEKGEG